jgi:tetratricopeptide (TPR) repeat protein
LEQYPAWLELGWNNGWQAFGGELGRLREAAETSKLNVEDLEPRVLKLTIRELKRDLLGQDRRNPQIYYRGYQYFWAAKAGDFAAAANEVYREHKSSGRRVVYIAGYLWSGLDLHARAIEIMLDAHKQGLLDESGEVQLVDYLHSENRFGESIAIIEPLVKDHSDAMQYRTRLMTAYDRTGRRDQLDELVRDTEKHFHRRGLWTEDNIAEFGRGALGCHLLDRAVDYYKEAISLHQRSNPASGNGDSALSYMYQQLAEAHSQLGQTEKAVEAASGAIVCWGPQHVQRGDAINKLRQVLANAKDLDAYVQSLDASKQDSPILRKAIGQTYQARGKFDKAITQLNLAAAMQPADTEVQQALVACYDATGKKREATLALLAEIDVDRHNLVLYTQLADRLKNDEAEAERAATSIIEAGPHEAENQAAMAELRQKQGRWNEAIPHWQQAADLRRLEPTNLVKLIEAELHAQQWDAARQSLRKLQQTEWPSRFNTVENDIRRLLDQLPK